MSEWALRHVIEEFIGEFTISSAIGSCLFDVTGCFRTSWPRFVTHVGWSNGSRVTRLSYQLSTERMTCTMFARSDGPCRNLSFIDRPLWVFICISFITCRYFLVFAPVPIILFVDRGTTGVSNLLKVVRQRCFARNRTGDVSIVDALT